MLRDVTTASALRRHRPSEGYPPAVGYLLVFVIAAGVGVAVYALTLRDGMQPIPGFSEPDPPKPEGSYVSVAGGTPDWQSRLTGLLGLVVAVVIGAVALAAVLYISIDTIVRLLGNLAPEGSAVGP
jgi:hypothetical protein